VSGPSVDGPDRRLPQTGVADLVRVAQRLRARGATLATAAELLGVAPALSATGEPMEGHPERRPSVSGRESIRRPPVAVAPGGGDTVSDAPGVAMAALPFSGTAEAVTGTGPSLDELLGHGRRPAPAQPLFNPGTRRGLIRALGAVRRPTGDVDVAAVIDAVAMRRPLVHLPRQWISETSGRLELLLDTGLAMAPFRRDVDGFPEELRRVLGPDVLELGWFRDCPLLPPGVLRENQFDGESYVLPNPDVTVVAVTSVGVRGTRGAPAAVLRAWRDLADRAERSAASVILLTPLPVDRVAPLVPGLSVVTWDRAAGVRDVAHATSRRGSGRGYRK
jgi:hypothetical protein